MKHKTWFVLGMIVCLMVLLGGVNVQAADVTFYVIPGAAGTCSGWGDACDLQTALDDAVDHLDTYPGETVEIWVAAGTYKPTSGIDRTATFQLINDVEIYGGFDGTETILGDRDWETNITILSGDLNGDDGPEFTNRTDNSYNVVTGSGVDATAVLDGFTIMGGYADGASPDNYGGGMNNVGGSPTLSHIRFVGNYAITNGGGMYFWESAPILNEVDLEGNVAGGNGGGIFIKNIPEIVLIMTDLYFLNNSADHGGGIYSEGGNTTLTDVIFNGNGADTAGGGLYLDNGAMTLVEVVFDGNDAPTGSGGGMYNNNSDPVMNYVRFEGNGTKVSGSGGGLYNNGGSPMLTNVDFEGNVSTNGSGGGMYSVGSTPILNEVTFIGNEAASGGGMYNAGSSATLTNVLFSGNGATNYGGGIYNYAGSDPTLANVTFSQNDAVSGGGLYNFFDSDPILVNCILWENTADQIFNYDDPAQPSSTTVTYSNIQGGHIGVGNIDTNPFFIDPDGPDSSPGTTDDNLRLSVVSRAIDAGNNAAVFVSQDLDGNPRIVNGTVDMGAYENQVGLDNTSWPKAYQLPMNPDLDVQEASVDHPVNTLGQSRWYKFSVQPGSRVVVRLGNLAANYDVTLYKDIQVTYDSLIDPQDVDDLNKLMAEVAPDAYAPDAYAPDAYAPDAYAPDAYAPDAYAPDAYAPDAYAPDAYAPDAYAPDAYAPDAYAPDAYAPDAYAPDAYAPDKAYTSAQSRSLIGVSAFDGTADEFIAVNTWDNTGDFYIRVKGRNGAFNSGAPFHLEVTHLVGNCKELGVLPPVNFTTTDTGGYVEGYNTIILTDMGRMNLPTGEQTDLVDRLNDLALRPEVKGVVFDVDMDGDVTSANTEADDPDNLQCPYAKNLVALAIRDIIDGYREQNPNLEYVVIVGNDEVIPFFRYPDRALLASEKNYEPPVKNNTTSYASLNLEYVLSQDFYGATRELSLSNTTLPLPHLAVGRLVETPSEIISMLDAYQATGGVIQPNSAFVTGYDFLADAAEAIKSELEIGIGNNYTADHSLIAPRNFSPLDEDPLVWTADDLRTALFDSGRHDVIFLAGHFSAGSALAADYQTHLLASEVASSQTADLANAVVFSAGCHAGYNIVTEHGVQNLTQEPDWAQAFARQGASLIAGTGYQYGDTDFLEYSERLYLYFSQQLRAGTGPVPIGMALVRAKQDYLSTTPELRGIHEKALLETTLFGLPMLSVNMPLGRGDFPVPPAIVDATMLDDYPIPSPGNVLGLEYADVPVSFNLSRVDVPLTSVSDGSTVNGTYFEGKDGVVTRPGEPALPLELYDASYPGATEKSLRGIGFRGGSYEDLLDLTPLTGAPTTEVRGVHPSFWTEVFFPIRTWNANYFDALADSTNGLTLLALTPAQFLSDAPDVYEGTMRKFDGMDLRLFYSNHTQAYEVENENEFVVPSLAAVPSIVNVLATSTGSQVDFAVTVVGDPSAGIQEVWVTYTCGGTGSCNGQWQSIDLLQSTNDTRLWEGSLTLPTGTAADQVRYMAQAVNGVGMVSLSTNLGHYYQVDIDPAAPPPAAEQTALTMNLPQNTGAYNTYVSFSATLTSADSPVEGERVSFALGSQKRSALTNSSGVATVSFPLLAPPGDHTIRASFAGTSEYQRAAAASGFVIEKQPTMLTVSPETLVIDVGSAADFTVALKDSLGRPMREKTIFSLVESEDGLAMSSDSHITNFVGEALINVDGLARGTYNIHVYFSGNIPLEQPLTLDDPNYLASSNSGSLFTSGVTASLDPVPVSSTINATTAFIVEDNDGTYTLEWDWGDEVITYASTIAGNGVFVEASHTYNVPGVYTLRVELHNENNTTVEVAEFQYVTVYDPTGGFVTGGGWIDSPAGAYTDDATLTGKATFGFVSKYKKGASTPSGNTQFQFKAGDLNFRSDSYEWLVIAGSKAMYKGVGTIKGWNGEYGFMISAIDADLNQNDTHDFDSFRIKIWDIDTEEVVYDNQVGDSEDADPTTAIDGGSITIHK